METGNYKWKILESIVENANNLAQEESTVAEERVSRGSDPANGWEATLHRQWSSAPRQHDHIGQRRLFQDDNLLDGILEINNTSRDFQQFVQ